ncbi:MAG: aminotransferase class V-fold PLP-dependent enzyme [Actinomycetota bacterium]|nr:aminotransferase class V-fold PLP-dependent enzyme [Actinomycetota bacterium]
MRTCASCRSRTSHNGVVNDIVAIGDALRFSGSAAWYLVDACQSVGQMPVDASRIGADFISATGRKFLRGPRGTGFLIASDRALTDLEPYPLDLHSATWTGGSGFTVATGAHRFETWERSYAALLGMGAAIEYALDLGLEAIRARIDYLATRLRGELAGIEGVTVRDRGAEKSGIVTITVPAPGASQMVRVLRERGINTSLSTPDYAPDEFARGGIDSMVRLSPHVYTTDVEIDLAIATIAQSIESGT